MKRGKSTIALVAAAAMLLPGVSLALTRELADLRPASLTFDRSVLNQVSFDIYRDPFDELQTRPYNLLFSNIGRHANLSPWPDQEGNYARYLNALIGNNGRSNIDNDADAIQGSFGMRQTDTIAWGVSAAFLGGNLGDDSSNVTTTFTTAASRWERWCRTVPEVNRDITPTTPTRNTVRAARTSSRVKPASERRDSFESVMALAFGQGSGHPAGPAISRSSGTRGRIAPRFRPRAARRRSSTDPAAPRPGSSHR